MSRWGIGLSEKMKACKEAEPFTDILEGDGGVPEKDPPSSSKAGFKVTTMKIIVWVCILNGLAWVWCSYIRNGGIKHHAAYRPHWRSALTEH